MSSVSAAQLKQVSFFSSLDDGALTKVASLFAHRSVQPGATIVARGDSASELFFILSGKVKIVASGAKEVDTATSGCFGELAILYDIKRTASVVAVDATELAVLGKAAFEQLRSEYAEIGNKIKQIAAERFDKFKAALQQADLGDATSFTDEQVNNFKAIYQDIDTDKSGTIDKDELGILLERLTGTKPSPNELQIFLERLDSDKNGKIDFDEFLNGLRHLSWFISLKAK